MGSVPERDSQAVVRRRRPLLSCRLVRSSAVHRSGWLIAGAIGAFAFAVSADAVTRIGTSGPDVLRGSRSADELYGRAGSDRLLGLSGRDILDGGAGPDVVVGGADSDLLIGGSGHDLLRARDGDGDRLRCGQGRDTAVVDSVDAVGGCEVIRRPAPPAPEAPPPARTQPPPSPIALENQKPGTRGWASFGGGPPGAIEATHPSAPLPASRSPSTSRPIRARPIGFSSSESVGTGVSGPDSSPACRRATGALRPDRSRRPAPTRLASSTRDGRSPSAWRSRATGCRATTSCTTSWGAGSTWGPPAQASSCSEKPRVGPGLACSSRSEPARGRPTTAGAAAASTSSTAPEDNGGARLPSTAR